MKQLTFGGPFDFFGSETRGISRSSTSSEQAYHSIMHIIAKRMLMPPEYPNVSNVSRSARPTPTVKNGVKQLMPVMSHDLRWTMPAIIKTTPTIKGQTHFL